MPAGQGLGQAPPSGVGWGSGPGSAGGLCRGRFRAGHRGVGRSGRCRPPRIWTKVCRASGEGGRWLPGGRRRRHLVAVLQHAVTVEDHQFNRALRRDQQRRGVLVQAPHLVGLSWDLPQFHRELIAPPDGARRRRISPWVISGFWVRSATWSRSCRLRSSAVSSLRCTEASLAACRGLRVGSGLAAGAG